MNRLQRRLALAMGLLTGFLLWTLGVSLIDVQPIGPERSAVGFATLNGFFHGVTGVHWELYILTDWLSLIPFGIIGGFGILGLVQWMQRKHITKVDRSLLILGGFYVLVLGIYVLFEWVVINDRPILIDGILEASYPSSTTMLVLCVMPTAVLQLRSRIQRPGLRKWVSVILTAFTLFMVVARLISGVHWLTDIVGGILLSSGLVMAYHAATSLE